MLVYVCLCLSQFHSAAQEMESWEDVLLGAYTYTQMITNVHIRYTYVTYPFQIICERSVHKVNSSQASSRFQGPRRQFAQGEDEGGRLLGGAKGDQP